MKKNQREHAPSIDKTDKWHSPELILEGARDVLGGIDLDPASSEIANKRVKAKQFFTEKDNPLERDWHGSVFLNPPSGDTGRLLPKAFWNHLIDQVQKKNAPHAIFLAFRLEMIRTTQFGCKRCLLDFPTLIFKKRLIFLRENGEPATQNTSPSCLVYIPGQRNMTGTFIKKFSHMGVIVGRR